MNAKSLNEYADNLIEQLLEPDEKYDEEDVNLMRDYADAVKFAAEVGSVIEPFMNGEINQKEMRQDISSIMIFYEGADSLGVTRWNCDTWKSQFKENEGKE